MIRRRPVHEGVTAALLLVLLSACQSWRPTYVSPQQLIPVEQPSSVRITARGGARATLGYATTRNDSIFGVTDAGQRVGVASEDLLLLEVRAVSLQRSIGLGLSIVLFVLFAGGLAEAGL